MSEGLSAWKRIWNSKNQPGEQDEDVNRGRFQICILTGPKAFSVNGVFWQKPEDRAISKSQTMGNGCNFQS